MDGLAGVVWREEMAAELTESSPLKMSTFLNPSVAQVLGGGARKDSARRAAGDLSVSFRDAE